MQLFYPGCFLLLLGSLTIVKLFCCTLTHLVLGRTFGYYYILLTFYPLTGLTKEI